MFAASVDPFDPATGAGAAGETFISTFSAQLESALTSSLNVKRIEKFYITLNNAATQLNTNIGNGLAANIKTLEETLFTVYKEGIQYGIAWEDAGKYLNSAYAGMDRLVPMSSDIATKALVFGKAIGETPENVGLLVANFTKFGVSQEKSITNLNRIASVAKASGLDSKKLTKTVSDNMKMAASYGFKDGVEGLTRMAAQAQRLGMDIKKTQGFADSILEGGIEEAVKVSTELQMLGGSNGALANAESLYYMSLYDVEGLQTELAKANQSAVEFNETTGDFKISGENALMLRQKAKLLGTTYDEVAQGAINMRKELMISEKVDLTKLNKGAKDLVTSLAEVKAGGVITIDLPGFDEGTDDLAKLMNNSAFVTALEAYEKDSLKSDANLQTEMFTNAKTQLSVQERMDATLITIREQGAFGVGLNKGRQILQKGEDSSMYGENKVNIDNYVIEAQAKFNALGTSLITFYQYQKEITIMTTQALVQAMKDAVDAIMNTIDSMTVPTTVTPTPSLPPMVLDAFVPGDGQSFVQTGNYGDFFTSKGDEMAIGPGISDFFKNYNQEMNMLKNIEIPNNSKTLTEYQTANASPKENLTDLLTKNSNPYNKNESTGSDNNLEILKNLFNTKIETINKQTVDIGGQTNISVDISSNLPSGVLDLVDKTKLKEKVMSIINERLSVGFGDKLSNALIPQKRG